MINKKDVVLDVGTGDGRDAFYLSKFSKIIYGIDKSDEVIKLNKKKLKLEKNCIIELKT